VLDDCSPDDSVEIARCIKDARISVAANERNLGTYGTQQRGLDETESDYVAILNSDDLWEPAKLQAQVEALDASPDSGFCYTLGWKIDAQGEVDRSEDVHLDWPVSDRQELLPYLLYENRVLASGVLFRRSGLRFDPTCRYSGDWVSLLEIARRRPCACVPERLTYWRIHGANTFTASQKQLLEEIRVREAISGFPHWFVPRLDRSPIACGLAKNAMNLTSLYAVFLDSGKARRSALSALRMHPRKGLALKRALGAFAPAHRFRSHLWGDKLDWSGIDEAAGREGLRSQRPLEISL
jgi:glycosyltransferase involved in cell wall biosynthesis